MMKKNSSVSSSVSDQMKRSNTYDEVPSEDHTKGYSLYIFNLNPNTTDSDLWRLFCPFGSVRNVAIMKDPVNQKPKGYAFVTMNNKEDASLAIDILNGQSLNGRSLKISFKNAKRFEDEDEGFGEPGAYILYVYNISAKTQESQIWKLFAQFGAVKNVAIFRDFNRNYQRGHAFITMKEYEDAVNAIKTLNGFTLDNRILNVSFKSKKSDYNNDQRVNNQEDYIEDNTGAVAIYVSNLAQDTEDHVLWKLFAQFGAVKDVNTIRDPVNHRCIGYGFVVMKNFDDAILAINTLNESKLNGKTLQVSLKKKTEKYN